MYVTSTYSSGPFDGTRLVPIVKEYPADTLTPISVFSALRQTTNACLLLESAEKGKQPGRYSIIGINPMTEIIINRGRVEFHGKIQKTIQTSKPLEVLRETLNQFRLPDHEELSPFAGGIVGYLSYDILRYYEKLPKQPQDDTGFPDAHLFLITEIMVYNHLKNLIRILRLVPENEYRPFLKNQILDDMDRTLKHANSVSNISALPSSSKKYSITSNFTREDYIRAVKRAKEYIRKGDIFQVVLSQRVTYSPAPEAFQVYRKLRSINPSPYMFFLDYGNYKIVGSSPECLVKVEGDTVETYPIAGTRPRGATPQEDKHLAQELREDEKEKAEHAMLVDLGRNDIGKVSRFGTVKVDGFMHVENYSHVMHLVSRVSGKIAPGFDCFDALIACLPAGTVSGAPKLKAMEIIDELEPSRRGPYAGAVGYFDFRGNMNTCITIRSLFFKDSLVHLQAGAGIVADSVPEKEYEETLNKLKALTKALELGKVKDQ